MSTELKLIQDWLEDIHILQIGHLRAAARYNTLHRLLGVPVVVLSTAVGTSIFGSLAATSNDSVLVFAGTASVLAAVLAGLQSFLNYGERASKHQESGNSFSQLRRSVQERIALKDNLNDQELGELLDDIQNKWARAEQASPTLPQGIHDTAYEIVSPQKARERKQILRDIRNQKRSWIGRLIKRATDRISPSLPIEGTNARTRSREID